MSDAGGNDSTQGGPVPHFAGNDQIANTIRSIAAQADAQSVFAEPVTDRGVTLMPAASVTLIAEFGIGSGYGTYPQSERAESGGGGGAAISAPPVAVIRASEDDIEVVYVVDPTRIVMAGLAAAVFLIVWIARLIIGTAEGNGANAAGLARAVRGLVGSK